VEEGATGAASSAVENVQGVQQTLSELAPGRDPGVWTVPTENDVQQLFDELTVNGSPITWKNYGGTVVELPDGTQIGIRPYSGTGGSTIDIRLPGVTNQWKVHVG
jgi:hypothetical protein